MSPNSKFQKNQMIDICCGPRGSGPTGSGDGFNFECRRLSSFLNVKNQFLQKKKEEFAIQGFYFFGNPDKVRCHFCGLVLEKWENDDNPLADHLKYNRNCKLLKGSATDNVPINAEALSLALPIFVPDECSHSSKSENIQHPHYELPNRRFQTFELWPASMKQRPQEMVESGFYYTGVSDRVICFCCGLGLGQWDADDIPWIEHAKKEPDCEYLKMTFGAENVIQHSHDTPIVNKTVTSGDILDEEMETKESTCKICFGKRGNTALVPCGHIFCGSCVFSMETCPICRRRIEKALTLYYP